MWRLAILAACGCSSSSPSVTSPAASPMTPSPVWVGWRLERGSSPLVRVCDRDEPPRAHVGAAGCWRGGVGGPIKATDDGFVGGMDLRDAVPGGRCTLAYRDGTARAELVLAGRVIDTFEPDPDPRTEGTMIRASFSPDDAWLAVIHLVQRRLRDGTALEVDRVVVVPVAASPCATSVPRG